VGGNAIGTGMNTPRAFRPAILSALNAALGEHFTVAENGIEITQFLTDLAHMSSMLRLLALDLQKLCNDLRLLASGPNTGFAEIILPAVEPGSSIMPGKVNPTVCEAVQMACLRVLGHDHAVAAACGAGQLELNTHMPLVACNLIESFQLLEQCCAVLSSRCIADIAPNRKACARHFERGAALATILNPRLGYDKAAALVKEALALDRTVRELAIEKGLLSAEEFDALARAATGPTDAA
jgi:aspartate ammonia-lyase